MTPPDVRVFSVDLDQPAEVVARLDTLLPEGERDVTPPRRVARASIRIVLAEAIGGDPRSVRISRVCEHCGHPTHGRPTVVGDDDISFGLSHTGAFALLALTGCGARIGIDVEEVRPRPRLDALAARVLSPDAHAAWLSLDDDGERLRSFLRSWTAKEAYLKALGIGISTRLRDVPARVDGWTTCELAAGNGRVAALAIDRAEFEVRPQELVLFALSNGGIAG